MLQGQKVEIKTGGEFDPIPMDKYTVQCVDVNLVKQLKYQSTEEEDVLNYQFAILDDKPMKAEDGTETSTRGRYLWKKCRLSLNNRSWLGKLAKAIIGRDLTKEEAATFDVESVVGKQVDVIVENVTSKDGQKVFSNIAVFDKTTKKLTPMDEKDIKKVGQVVEKTTTPATAPDADDEADKLVSDLEAEGKSSKDAEAEAAQAEAEALELEAKAAAAKAKAAKAKAEAAKK